MKKILIAGSLIVAVLVVAGIFLLGNINSVIKKGIETAGPKILKADVSLNSVDIDVASGAGELAGLTIGNPAGFQTDYAFKLGSIRMEMDVASVTTGKIHIKSIVIKKPDMVYEGLVGKNNLEQLQANAMALAGKGKNKADSAPGKKVLIDYVRIEKGTISVSSSLLQGNKLSVALPPIELKDIGKNKDATMADAAQEILLAVNKAVLPAVQAGLGSIGSGVKEVGGAITEGAQKGIEGIKGLFGN